MTITLRDYQRDAASSVFAHFERSKAKGNPLVVLPTGSGKSLVLAEVVRQARARAPDTRALVLCHRKELVQQDAKALLQLDPTLDVGIYSASLSAKQVRSVTVAQYQSARVKPELWEGFDLVIVDEAHLIPQEDAGSYRELLRQIPAAVVGLTATPFRLDGGRLTRGKDRIFSSICYDLPVRQLVDEGYLSPLVAPSTSSSIDTRGVQVRGGEFVASSLDAPAQAVTRAALAEAREVAKDRRHWIVFAVSIEHAKLCAHELSDLLFGRVAIVTGETPQGERDSTIAAFRRGEIRALVNVDVLTTGFDAPLVDCIVLLRPTQSTGLYVQIVGRGMRRAEGKANCLLLDYGGNVERHGPIDALKIKREGSGGKVERRDTWDCPRCDAEVALRVTECPECGQPRPEKPRLVDHDTKASRASAMGGDVEPAWLSVRATRYWRHEKADKPPSVGVAYQGSVRTVAREWVCPEHVGFAASKFAKWWTERGGGLPVPATVDDTIARVGELRRVEAVEIVRDGEWDRVRQARLAPPREPGEDDDKDDDASSGEDAPLWEPQWADDELPF